MASLPASPVAILRKLLQHGEWCLSAIELDVRAEIDGETLRDEAEAAVKAAEPFEGVAMMPVPATAYVVIGTCGADGDQRDWPVRAFVSQAEACACAMRANDYAKTEPRASTAEREAWAAANPCDPEMRISNSTDTFYYTTAVPFTP